MNNLNESKNIVIQSKSKEHVGFILPYPSLAESNGDCVFSIIPKNPQLFDSEEVKVLFSIKESGEHQWRWSKNDIIISYQKTDIIKLSENKDVIHIPTEKLLGVWKIPQKTE